MSYLGISAPMSTALNIPLLNLNLQRRVRHSKYLQYYDYCWLLLSISLTRCRPGARNVARGGRGVVPT